MKAFSERVYETVSKIPKGKVASYGQIARLAGARGAARAVGRLMANNKNPTGVPCHRVVGSNGALVGYAFKGIGAKRAKLIDEGVSFRGAHVNLATSLWKK